MLLFTVIGNPIAHSLSPRVHAEFAKQHNLDMSYTKTEISLDGLAAMLLTLKSQGYLGVNITSPFKEEAFQLAHLSSVRAERARAANILTFLPDGSIYADNSDGIGLVTDIMINHHYPLQDKKVLILGAGGAVRGILHAILHATQRPITIVNRTESKAKRLAAESSYPEQINVVSFDELEDDYDVIIDGASWGAGLLPLSDACLQHATLVYDLKYGQEKLSPLLEKARLHKVAYCLTGLGMLVEQAAVAFTLWTGMKPNTQQVLALLR